VLSVAMLLAHVGLDGAAARVEKAVAEDLSTRATRPEARRSTAEIGDALAAAVSG
jgi:3-isopropylmalate dehydrogenase